MGIPDFLAKLRAVVGHDLLWLPSVSAVVVDEAGRILLNQRADNSRWALIGGLPEPGEQPATAVVREVYEETGVHVVPEWIASVRAHPVDYPNGDRCEYLNVSFRCRPVGGHARVNDDESLAVGWFGPGELPSLDDHALICIEHATGPAGPAWFQR